MFFQFINELTELAKNSMQIPACHQGNKRIKIQKYRINMQKRFCREGT
ncbi:hypothetical protein YERSI8AC_260129 [Enterobacterales bacterium 8AC]|nr:hypothetical protein YERSI8AC_260129 [Enterobacterales bacterium 8AC]